MEIRIEPSALEKEERVDGHEVGEVVARGPNVFRGYRNLPDKTDEVFAENRWFRTGDMGYFDNDGNLHLLGRLSTLIKTESGEKIQTEDVETAYTEESAIREIGVLEKKGKLPEDEYYRGLEKLLLDLARVYETNSTTESLGTVKQN